MSLDVWTLLAVAVSCRCNWLEFKQCLKCFVRRGPPVTRLHYRIIRLYICQYVYARWLKLLSNQEMLSSKWKLIRNILNWFGLYSNSKPEFLLLVVKLDKCFMVKPFKSTYNTQWYTQIGPNIHFRIIIDSLLYPSLVYAITYT